MSATPSRVLLLLTGAGLLALFAARVTGPTFMGLKVAGGMVFWHFLLGVSCLVAGGLARHDYTARAAAFALALTMLVIGVVIAGTRVEAGYTAADAFMWVGASGGLFVGALFTDPREETHARRISG